MIEPVFGASLRATAGLGRGGAGGGGTGPGTVIMESDSFDAPPNQLDNLPPGRSCFIIQIPSRTLGPGDYQVYLKFTSPSHFAGWNVDSPGIVDQFRLNDDGTQRGNRRRGYFSTRLGWKLRNSELKREMAA